MCTKRDYNCQLLMMFQAYSFISVKIHLITMVLQFITLYLIYFYLNKYTHMGYVTFTFGIVKKVVIIELLLYWNFFIIKRYHVCIPFVIVTGQFCNWIDYIHNNVFLIGKIIIPNRLPLFSIIYWAINDTIATMNETWCTINSKYCMTNKESIDGYWSKVC